MTTYLEDCYYIIHHKSNYIVDYNKFIDQFKVFKPLHQLLESKFAVKGQVDNSIQDKIKHITSPQLIFSFNQLTSVT